MRLWMPGHGDLAVDCKAWPHNPEIRSAGAVFLRQGQPVSWVAQQFHLDWGTVKKLDKMMLKKFYEHVDVSRLRRLAIDEFALQKAHKYATTFMDLDTGKIIFVCRGKTNAAVRKGFEMLKLKVFSTRFKQ